MLFIFLEYCMINKGGSFDIAHEGNDIKLAFYKPNEKYSLYDEAYRDTVLRSPKEFDGIWGDMALYYLYSRVLQDILMGTVGDITQPFACSIAQKISPALVKTIQNENFGDYVGMGIVHAHREQITRLFESETKEKIHALSVHIGRHSHTHNGFTVNALDSNLRRVTEKTMIGIDIKECQDPKYVVSILSKLFGVPKTLFPSKTLRHDQLEDTGTSHGNGLDIWPPKKVSNHEGFFVIAKDKMYEGLHGDEDVMFELTPLHGLSQLCTPDEGNKMNLSIGLQDDAFVSFQDAYRVESMKFGKKSDRREEEGHIHQSEWRQLREMFRTNKSALLQFFGASKIIIEKTMEYIPGLDYIDVANITFIAHDRQPIATKKVGLAISKDGAIRNIHKIASCLMESGLTTKAVTRDDIKRHLLV
ncbi:MAG: hypothetical protein WC004_05235 [Candidatus Absconditabacterales bacterium]